MPPNRAQLESLFIRFGGTSGVVYSTLPIVAFIGANTFLSLVPAVTVALGVAACILLWRLWRGYSYQPAVAGFMGVAVGATVSLLTGQSKDYFLLHIWVSLLWATVLTASILVRHALVGQIWSWLVGSDDRSWRGNVKVVIAFDAATLVWALVFLSRFIVQYRLYAADQTTWLGIARIVMGWPLTALAAAITYRAVQIARRAQPHPDAAPDELGP